MSWYKKYNRSVKIVNTYCIFLNIDHGKTVTQLDREESKFNDQSNVLKNLILNSKKYVGKGKEDIFTLLEFSKEELKDMKQKNEELQKCQSTLDFVGKFTWVHIFQFLALNVLFSSSFPQFIFPLFYQCKGPLKVRYTHSL